MTIATDRAIEPFKEIRDVLAPYADPERFILLMPTTFVGVSPLYIPMPVVVKVNPRDKRAVYPTPGANDGTLCLHSTELEKIANAGGLDFDPKLDVHVHDFQKEPYLCQVSVGGWYMDAIGQRRLVGDGVTQDLRDGSKRVRLLLGREGRNDKAVEAGRQFICEQARSRARNRVIKKTMGLASSYTEQELSSKAFVALRFRLNEADEDVKKALLDRAMGVTREVFRGAALPEPSGIDEGEDLDERDVAAQEPEIPDRPTAAAPASAPAKKQDVNGIMKTFRERAAARGDDVDKIGDPGGTVAYALQDVLGLPTDKDVLGLVRRKMVGILFGVTVNDLTAAKVAVLDAAAKDAAGKLDIQAVFAHLAQVDDGIRAIADSAKGGK